MPIATTLGVHVAIVFSDDKTVIPPSWVDLGGITDFSWRPEKAHAELWAPREDAGVQVCLDRMQTRFAPGFSCTIGQISAPMFELAQNTEAIAVGGAGYVPGSGLTKRGWARVRSYQPGEEGSSGMTDEVYLFGVFEVDDVKIGGELVAWTLTFKGIDSTVQTGTCQNLA